MTSAVHEWGLICERSHLSACPLTCRDLFSRAHSLNASHVPTLLGWALLEDLCGDLDRARELLRMGLAVDPRNTQLRVAMAQHLHKSRGEGFGGDGI